MKGWQVAARSHFRYGPLPDLRYFEPRNRYKFIAQFGRCAYCGGELAVSLKAKPQRPTRDHVVPRSKGGMATRPNIVLAHADCNVRKGNREPFACEMMFAAVTAEIVTSLRRRYQGAK